MEAERKSHRQKFIYSDDPDLDAYYNKCDELELPSIVISSRTKGYVLITFDLLPCLPFHKLKGDITPGITQIYRSYTDFFLLPKSKFSYAGGSNSLGMVVKKKHAEFIAEQLYSYIESFLKKNKQSLAI